MPIPLTRPNSRAEYVWLADCCVIEYGHPNSFRFFGVIASLLGDAERIHLGGEVTNVRSELPYRGQSIAQGQHHGRDALIVADLQVECAHQFINCVPSSLIFSSEDISSP
jgi:hypothetical protein